MSIPASFLSAALPKTLPVVQRTARTLAQQATQAFGEWFQAPSPKDSGLSEETSEAKTYPGIPQVDPQAIPSRGSERAALREKLAQWILQFASQMGLGDQPPEVTIVADGVGIPQVEGPENLSDSLQESLRSQPDLIDTINQAARQDLESDPLRWMPGHEPRVRFPVLNK